jgi:hypothetical protein
LHDDFKEVLSQIGGGCKESGLSDVLSQNKFQIFKLNNSEVVFRVADLEGKRVLMQVHLLDPVPALFLVLVAEDQVVKRVRCGVDQVVAHVLFHDVGALNRRS